MGLLRPKESRFNCRRPLMGDLSGQLFTVVDRRSVPCLAIDVSIAGLRILSKIELTPGSTTVLDFKGRIISLRVVWCRPEGKKADAFATGLVTTNPQQNLVEFFTSIGWLRETHVSTAWLDEIEFVSQREA